MAEASSVVPVPFVTRLRSMCQHVDKNMALLKLDLSRPPGSTPFTYDRGLNAIKSDICDLKKKCEELKPAVESINNFSNWLHSLQELVNQQAEDVKKREEYLMKFGYKPVPNPTTEVSNTSAPKVEIFGKVSTSESRTTEMALQDPSNKKPVVVASSQNNKQAKVPLVSAAAPKLAKDIPDTVEYQKTPLSSRNKKTNYLKQSAGRGSCYTYGRSTTVELWLQGIENCMLELTPDVLRVKRVPVERNQEQRDKMKTVPEKTELPHPESRLEISEENTALTKVPETPAQNHLSIPNIDDYHNTPVEPELSEYTTQLLSFKASLAGKESVTTQGKQIFDRNTPTPNIRTILVEDPPHTCSNGNETVKGKLYFKEEQNQEETTLTYKGNYTYSNLNLKNSTPEEPVLSYQTSTTIADHIDTVTPEEPVLSKTASEYTNSNQMALGTLRDPVLSYQLPKIAAASEVDAKTPEEPVLSFQNIKPVTTTEVDSKTPEEPVLSYQIATKKAVESVACNASASVKSHLGYHDELPSSPQFSDITQSFLSATNQGYPRDKESNKEEKFGRTVPHSQDSWTLYRNDKHHFGRGGREISHTAQSSQLFSKASQENILPPPVDSQEGKKKWHHPGITFEKFLGGGNDDINDDIPPSPQLSETTQRLFARLY